MTPATTDRGRNATGKLRSRPAPAAPRRVSGPLGGRAAVAGEARRATQGRPVYQRSGHTPFTARISDFVRALPDHGLIDRLVRGRAWIPVLGVLLAGIVAMQVSLLKLGANIGRSLQTGATLQSQNEQLRASVATLADDQRIEKLAGGMGMVMPTPQAVGFLSVRPASVQQALANIKAPDSTAFLSALQSTAAAIGTATSTAASGLGAGTITTPASPASAAGTITTPASPASAAGPAGATGASAPATGTDAGPGAATTVPSTATAGSGSGGGQSASGQGAAQSQTGGATPSTPAG
jgi:hypothetical protein